MGRKGGVFSFFLLCHFLSFFLFFLGKGGEEEEKGEEVKTVSLALFLVPEPCVGDINQLASVWPCVLLYWTNGVPLVYPYPR